ncbi:MAG: hypothetical protein KF841_09215 [Phycisphaerae bacterium]|nr:hypothetical protein [Phycisphaerae bacterium]
MTIDLLAIESRLRNSLCPKCVRFTRNHGCSLPKDRMCSVFKNIGDLVTIVRSTHARQIEPYATVLREQVCAACHYEDGHGNCPCRIDLDCALDVYYPLIVDTIEQELIKQGALPPE